MKQENSEDGWWQFLNLCAAIKKPELLNELFILLLTIEERETIAGRCLIVKELLKGDLTQREMALQLKQSIAKITRGSNQLKTMGDELKGFLKRKLL